MTRGFLIRLLVTTFSLVVLVKLYQYSSEFHEMVFTIDSKVFFTLNNTLSWGGYWLVFWGYLNHYYESYFNVLPILIIIISTLKLSGNSTKEMIVHLLYYIITLQAVIYLHKHIYTLPRISPSYYYENNFLSIIKLLHNDNLKCTSQYSFPSGHTLAFFYSFYYIRSFNIKYMTYLSLGMSIFFSIPRLIAGAHWFSDAIYSVILAYFFFLLFYSSGIEKWIRLLKVKTT
jgi:membrane-associated phospholipid phosphatase